MYNQNKRNKLSVFMSLLLRHKPEKFGLYLDNEGFCPVDSLLTCIQKENHWSDATRDTILQIVKECPKQRYEIRDDFIRARYGHSKLKVSYEEKTPPVLLYHGTYEGAVDSIFQQGILPMSRQFVHLSESTDFATLAGKRRGKPVILEVDCKQAAEDGIPFYYAGNEVWLTASLPASYLKLKK